MSMLTIRATTRTRRRIGGRKLPADGSPMTVDLSNPAVKRDLSRAIGFWAPVTGEGLSVDFTVGDEDDNVINVSAQLVDAAGNNIEEQRTLTAFLATVSEGVVTPATATGFTVDDGTSITALTAHRSHLFVTEADGSFSFDTTSGTSGTNAWHVVVVLPDGSHAVSPVAQHVDNS